MKSFGCFAPQNDERCDFHKGVRAHQVENETALRQELESQQKMLYFFNETVD
ncbi:MAG TPA: hypothetical protein VE082_08155 [Desulfobaccales bacterium]|nr:hypothetical protein [Desulfobaccales bacterium]